MKGATLQDLAVRVRSPNGADLPVQLIEDGSAGSGSYKAKYTPLQVGEHSIDIDFFKKPIRGSPFKCYAYDASRIRVGDIPDGFVGQPVEFEIDGSEAGSGNLEILVNGGRIATSVKSLPGQQRFLASFTPMDAMVHTVEMSFNGDVVPDSPWQVNIYDPQGVVARGEALRYFNVQREASFDIITQQSSALKTELVSQVTSKYTVYHDVQNLFSLFN